MISRHGFKLLKCGVVAAAACLFALITGIAGAQDRLKTMPGYEHYREDEQRDSHGRQGWGL